MQNLSWTLRAVCLAWGMLMAVVESKAVQSSYMSEDSVQPIIVLMDTTSLSPERVVGKVDPFWDDSFRLIDLAFASREIYLHCEAADKFEEMCSAALADSIYIRAISGLRTFEYQRGIWNKKWEEREGEDKEKALSILRYSSMPMTSRHHWGTDVDINSLENSYFEEGKGLLLYEWLCRNAHRYGFHQVFSDKRDGRTGYEEEKWHWSYMPLAEVYLDYYNKHIRLVDLAGFDGALAGQELDVIRLYVNGIDHPKHIYIVPQWQVNLLKLCSEKAKSSSK